MSFYYATFRVAQTAHLLFYVKQCVDPSIVFRVIQTLAHFRLNCRGIGYRLRLKNRYARSLFKVAMQSLLVMTRFHILESDSWTLGLTPFGHIFADSGPTVLPTLYTRQ